MKYLVMKRINFTTKVEISEMFKFYKTNCQVFIQITNSLLYHGFLFSFVARRINDFQFLSISVPS